MMIVAYFDSLKDWEKIFVYYVDDTWDTEPLKIYFDNKKYQWICNQIEMILQHRENTNQFEGIYIDKDITIAIKFLIGLENPS